MWCDAASAHCMSSRTTINGRREQACNNAATAFSYARPRAGLIDDSGSCGVGVERVGQRIAGRTERRRNLEPRPQRGRRSTVHAASPHHRDVRLLVRRICSLDQARLPHTGRSGDRNRPRVAGSDAFDEPSKCSQLGGASDEVALLIGQRMACRLVCGKPRAGDRRRERPRRTATMRGRAPVARASATPDRDRCPAPRPGDV